MKISRHQISAFAAVGREKSFTKAAQKLELGQSAITQHIQALEETIGNKLFIRSRSGTEFTNLGRSLYPIADQIRVLEEQFVDQANQHAELNQGTLSICVSTPRPAMAVIAAFQNCFPSIRVDLKLAPWRDAVKMLQQREVDAAIIIQPEQAELYDSQEVERRPFIALVPKQHRLAKRKRINLDELITDTLIMMSDSSYTRHCVDEKFDSLNLTPANTLSATTYEMMLEAVSHGLGVTIALEGAMSLHDGIVPIRIKEFDEEHAYVVACARGESNLHTIRALFGVAAHGAHKDGTWYFPSQFV